MANYRRRDPFARADFNPAEEPGASAKNEEADGVARSGPSLGGLRGVSAADPLGLRSLVKIRFELQGVQCNSAETHNTNSKGAVRSPPSSFKLVMMVPLAARSVERLDGGAAQNATPLFSKHSPRRRGV